MKPKENLITCIIYLILIGIGNQNALSQQKRSQNTVFIEATVLDKDTKEPLPFTNVIIEGTSIGTITNEEGKFELTISKKYAKNNVVFSFVGYENSSIPVSKFTSPKVKVYLSSASTPLEEIVVTAKNKYKEIVKEAIRKIPENYSQQPTHLDIYYRELTKVDQSYTKFSDAACTIYYSAYNQNFNKKTSSFEYQRFNSLEFEMKKVPYPEPDDFIVDERDQVKIMGIRKSDDLQKYKILEQSEKLPAIDPEHLKWLENNEIGGGPLRLTGADKVKRQEDFLDPKKIEYYVFKLFKKSVFNNKPVYILTFGPKDFNNTNARYLGEITIDEQSKAIVRYRYELTSLAKEKLNQKFGTQLRVPKIIEEDTKKQFISRTTALIEYQVFVTFSEFKGKWYLKRIKSINDYRNSGDLFDPYLVNTESEFVVNSVQTDTIYKFSAPEIFGSTFSNTIFNHPLSYQPEFWKNYSALVPVGVLGKALKDLESEQSLEEQFKDKK